MIGAPGIVMPLDITGHTTGFHFCAKTGLYTKVLDAPNLIHSELKAIIRDNMNSPTDFAMDDLFAVDGREWGGTGHADAVDPAGKDGIVLYDITNAKYLTMITAVHPTDPSGNYYRQWQGVLTNDYGVGSFNTGVVSVPGPYTVNMGKNLDSAAQFGFAYNYANQVFALITIAANDILTINWKITIG